MTKMSGRMTALVLLMSSLGGCAGMSEGPVPISQGVAPALEPDLSPIRDTMQTDCLNLAVPSNPTAADLETMRIRRNALVTAYMAAADIRYNAYERDLLAFSRQNDLGAALATQLLSAVGAASGSQAISEATNITSGAVGATQSAFSKSLLNQTVSVIQTHMRAQRRERFAVATRHLPLPYASWNSCQALQDALAYEQAGTLNAALAAMEASASEEEQAGNARAAQAIERVTQARDTFSVALQAYLAPSNAAVRRTRRDAARAIIQEDGLLANKGFELPERLSRILNDEEWSHERLALARRLVAADGAGTTALAATLPQ